MTRSFEPVNGERMVILVGFVAAILLIGPVLVLVGAGFSTMKNRRYEWQTAGIATAFGTVVWGLFVALYEHETPCDGADRCRTIYGFVAPIAEPNSVGYLVLAGGMLGASAILGATRTTSSIAIGASLVALPAVLAWWSAPRGDNDGLWVLIFWLLAFVGAFAAGCAETFRVIAMNFRPTRTNPTEG